VLVTNIAGNLAASALNLIKGLGKVGFSPGCLGEVLQNFGGAMGFAPMDFEEVAGLVRAQQADRINDGIGFLGPIHEFFQSITAGVILPIGDDQQNLLIAISQFE